MPLDPLAGLRSRAFNAGAADDYLSGGFRTASGQRYRTGFQDDVDEGVQDDINRRHLKSLAAIEAADKLRGDPMADQIEARKKALTYERLLPAGSEGSVKFGMGDQPPAMEYADDAGPSKNIGGRTVGEQFDVVDAYEKSRAKAAGGLDPKTAMEQDTYGYRQEATAALGNLRQGLDAKVRAGQMTPEEAKARLRAAIQRLAEDGALQEGDYGSVGRLLNPPAMQFGE